MKTSENKKIQSTVNKIAGQKILFSLILGGMICLSVLAILWVLSSIDNITPFLHLFEPDPISLFYPIELFLQLIERVHTFLFYPIALFPALFAILFYILTKFKKFSNKRAFLWAFGVILFAVLFHIYGLVFAKHYIHWNDYKGYDGGIICEMIE